MRELNFIEISAVSGGENVEEYPSEWVLAAASTTFILGLVFIPVAPDLTTFFTYNLSIAGYAGFMGILGCAGKMKLQQQRMEQNAAISVVTA